MHPPVLAQVGEPGEGLATLHAIVGLGPRVHHLVLRQVCAPAEGFPTLAAGVGHLAGLALLVGLRGAPEGLPPLSTRRGGFLPEHVPGGSVPPPSSGSHLSSEGVFSQEVRSGRTWGLSPKAPASQLGWARGASL